MVTFLLSVSLILPGLTLAVVLWSIARPENRIWPPRTFRSGTSFLGWLGTAVFFVSVFALGVIGWGELPISDWVRFGFGSILVVVGNAGVWTAVAGFGADQTMGAEGHLKTDGLYRVSRNPQYVSDIAILTGWALLSASHAALPAIVLGIAVFVAFPFAEEPWLEERYGTAYLRYRETVRRFL